MIFLFRVLPRALALTVLTLFCSASEALSRLLFSRFAPGLQLALRNRAFRLWGKGFSRIVGMRIQVEGTPPTGAFFLVANHLGYMDIFLLSSRVDAAFVAKADLRGWPALGAIFAGADTIFIDRGSRRDIVRVLDAAIGKLERGLGVILFPEGTSGRGDGLLPFRPSLLQLPASRDLPVSYACISYHTRQGDPPADQVVCWWGDAPFAPHILRLLRLRGFDARLRFGDAPVHHTDRKILADTLRDAMGSIFVPSTAEDHSSFDA